MALMKDSAPESLVIALAGNPNVGKSTVFNSLTGLKQHTGNWPGKTVTNARGSIRFKEKDFVLIDLPGTYSLAANSVEEEVARDFICFDSPDVTIVVTDATCLERNLNLVLQVLEITDRVVVCVNLMDEARKKGISVNLDVLSKRLGVPVIGTAARDGQGLETLLQAVYDIATQNKALSPMVIQYEDKIEGYINELETEIERIFKGTLQGRLRNRWIALKLLSGEGAPLEMIERRYGIALLNEPGILACLSEIEKASFKNDKIQDHVVASLVKISEKIYGECVAYQNPDYNRRDARIDKILTSRYLGFPIMAGLLGLVLWLTIRGANYPSELLANLLFSLEGQLIDLLTWLGTPFWLQGMLVDGVYKTLAWVVSVMLPPMAIFFPMFTLLEDLGYLPRVAFNLDNFFKKACAHGKQALTMCMGLGCNAAGVVGCRIIESPRERLIAIITNTFMPCNGRFPTLIAVSTMFIGGAIGTGSLFSAAILTGLIIMGVGITLLTSRLLSKTILKGLPSSFTLELPPYRKPQLAKTIVRSILDRTIFVLGRAMCVAAPAGLVIWLLANIHFGSISLLDYAAGFLNPFARLVGLDGYILMAFILGLPANEIVIPIMVMSYMSAGSMLELESLAQLKQLFIANGWTWVTAICVMVFCLMHYPCGTTLWTIKKETQSLKWTFLSFAIPTMMGLTLCFIIAQTARFLGLG